MKKTEQKPAQKPAKKGSLVFKPAAKKAEPVKAAPAKAEKPAPVKPAPVKAEKPAPVKPAPVKAEKPAPAKPAPVKAAPAKAAKPAPAPAPAKKEVSAVNGKWTIENVKGKFWFSLIAPNGQVMLESSAPYATLSSAKTGIKTYQDNIAADHLEIVEHKNGDSQVQILNGSGRLLATSSTYSTRSQAESARDSIKRWAPTDAVEDPD